MGTTYKIILLIFLALIVREKAFSSHLKAGEITSQRKANYSYSFTLTLYTDSTSVTKNSVLDEKEAILDFGDGTTAQANRSIREFIGNNTVKNIFVFDHTFPGPGNYTVGYQRDNRNADIKNIDNSASSPFYLESSVLVSPFLGVNKSPILTYDPIDEGVEGEIYIHNPGAFDPEGDSISYELGVPMQNKGVLVGGYQDPNFMGGSIFLDPVKGDFIWNTPVLKTKGEPNLFNILILIKEWRGGQLIGTIKRDMQITIYPRDNRAPVVKIPADTCIVAGTVLEKTITATDPDGDRVNLTAFGGPFTFTNPKALFNVSNPQTTVPAPAHGEFTWNTTCDLVREQPYQATFRAEDIGPPGRTTLTDLKTWSITILGPAPTGLTITSSGKGFQLSWDKYGCKASKMQIFRRDCDSASISADPCEKGLPAGFKKIGEVAIGTTLYQDTVNIHPGSFYCYIIKAIFPDPKGGRSLLSAQNCVVMNVGEALLTNVSVQHTDTSKGKILVKWTRPFDLDLTSFPGPYKYVVSRAEGLTGDAYSTIATLNDIADTSIVDSSLNTRGKSYHYRISFYYTQNGNYILKSTSVSASSVFLKGTPGGNKITLNWSYNVPWDNSDKNHKIFKEISPGVFTQLDEAFVSGTSGTYEATGLTNGDTVCFYVETAGEYCSEGLPKPLLNKSQIMCAVPHDESPPCPPVLFGPGSCIEDGVTQLTVFWKPDFSPGCNKEIKGYNVYYSEREDGDMELLASNVPDTFLIDTDNFSLAGCYAVTALNYYGAESPQSNKVCVDICVYYELPNLITPNKDNQNDLLRPFPVPKNVQQVIFSVYNRWGKKIYESDNNVDINWGGIDLSGEAVTSGIYFYDAQVIYRRRLRKKDEIRRIKGWVHVIQKDNEPVRE